MGKFVVADQSGRKPYPNKLFAAVTAFWRFIALIIHLTLRQPPLSSRTMAELTVQSERAFLKQPHIFQNPKAAGKTKAKRWYKDVGLGFKTPKEAIEGDYIGNPNTKHVIEK